MTKFVDRTLIGLRGLAVLFIGSVLVGGLGLILYTVNLGVATVTGLGTWEAVPFTTGGLVILAVICYGLGTLLEEHL